MQKSDPLIEKIAKKEPVRVTVTGAAGTIGYAALFRLAKLVKNCFHRILFSKNVRILNFLREFEKF